MKWLLVLLLATILLLVVLPAVYDQIRPPRTDVELARTARSAVELAREASRQDASPGSNSAWLLAIVVGTSVPLGIAYLIWRAADQHEPGNVELLAMAARQGLLQLPGPDDHRDPKLLPRQVEAGEPDSPAG